MVMVAAEGHDLKKTPLTDLHYADYKEFTGVVDFYSLDGDLVNGWNLQKGKVTGSRKPGAPRTTSPIRNQKLMNVLPPEDCTTREDQRWRNLCNTVYPIPGTSGEPVTTCRQEMYYVTVVLSCPDGGGTGEYTPPGGTGGTPDPNNPSPNIMDSLAAYPCPQGLVQTMPTIKSEIANKINTLFGRNETMNILFVADASLVGTSTDGQLKSYAGTTTAGTFKIALNPDVLNKASKEFILVTLYHEALHAYLAYKKMTLTPTQYSAQFSGYNVNGGRLLMAQDPAHWPMAYTNFVSGLASTVKSFNSNYDQSRADALAAGGITILSTAQATINAQERDTTVPGYTGTTCVSNVH